MQVSGAEVNILHQMDSPEKIGGNLKPHMHMPDSLKEFQ